MNEIVKLALLQQQANYSPYGVKTRYLEFKKDTSTEYCYNNTYESAVDLLVGAVGITIEIWFRQDILPATTSNRNYINNGIQGNFIWFCSINKDSASPDPYYLSLGGRSEYTDTLRATLYRGSAINTVGSWHHLAYTLEFTNKKIGVWIDGVQVIYGGASFSQDTLQKYAPGSFQILISSPTANYVMDGGLDDYRVWNHPRTTEQINQHMNHRLTGSETGLVTYWRMDEGTGSIAYDNSQNSNDGTIIRATWIYPTYGIKTMYMLFNQVDAAYIDCGNDASLNFGEGSFTIEFWMMRANNGDVVTSRRILGKGAMGNGTTDNGWTFWASTNGINFGVNPGANRTIRGVSGVMTAGTWYHIAGICDRSGYMSLLLNGVVVSYIAAPSGSVSHATNGLHIGNGSPLVSTLYWDGLVDEIRIWNYARTVAQINEFKDKRLVEGDSGLVGHYQFDLLDAATLKDSSQYGNHGTIYNALWSGLTYGVKTKYLSFNGSSDYVNCNNADEINFGTGSFTVECWIYKNATENDTTLFRAVSKGANSDATSEAGWAISMNNNTIGFMFNPTGVRTILYYSGYSEETWYHVAGVCDRSGNLELYVDGILKNSAACPSGSVTNAIKNLWIGRHSNGYWSGYVDEVRVWDHARTQQQIQDNMNNHLEAWTSGLIASYDLNDESGSTAKDGSLNDNDGTVYGAAWVS